MKKTQKGIFVLFLGVGLLIGFILKLQQKCIDRWKGLADKSRGQFLLMDQWVRIKQEGKNLEAYFARNGLNRIAIYGMGNVGLRLSKELEDSKIEIAYGIDRNAADIYSRIKVVTVNEKIEKVDAIVVTVIGGLDEVSNLLYGKIECPIIAIEDIVNEI